MKRKTCLTGVRHHFVDRRQFDHGHIVDLLDREVLGVFDATVVAGVRRLARRHRFLQVTPHLLVVRTVERAAHDKVVQRLRHRALVVAFGCRVFGVG